MGAGRRLLPWILALAGLVFPLVASTLAVWPVTASWVVLLALVWVAGRRLRLSSGQQLGMALTALPVLFVLAWEGGWFLIPADLAWLIVEFVDWKTIEHRESSTAARP
jgi:hypothetical protein